MNEKWSMFKNYMHNELGITKEDIREWVEDAVKQQAEKMVNQEFSSFSTHDIVRRMIMDDRYFGSPSLKKEVLEEVGKQLLEKMELTIKK